MINYDTGHLGFSFILRREGSVFPKAILMALPNAVVAVLLHVYVGQNEVRLLNMQGVDWLWAGFTSVLSFLIVFRNNQAYTRFWEGATLIYQVRGEWFDAVSTLFAFCNHSPEWADRVKTFRHTLIRLTSLLYCSALQQVCDVDDDRFEIIESRGMDQESLNFMELSHDRVEVVMQWIQRLIVDAQAVGTIDISAPLLTRAFQELSHGMVSLNNAKKIKDIPFPFPYSQMIMCMLLVHWAATPVIASQVVHSPIAAASVCFLVTLVLWSQIYITMEIDQPFGEDANDLPLRDMQKDFNHSLLSLMHPAATRVPTYATFPMSMPARGGGCASEGMRSSLTMTLETLQEPKPPTQLPDSMLGACTMSGPSLRLTRSKSVGSQGSQAERRRWRLGFLRRRASDPGLPQLGGGSLYLGSPGEAAASAAPDAERSAADEASNGSISDAQCIDVEGNILNVADYGRVLAASSPHDPSTEEAARRVPAALAAQSAGRQQPS